MDHSELSLCYLKYSITVLPEENLLCDNDPGKVDRLRREVLFYVADIGGMIVSEEDECAGHCRDHENCKALPFRDTDHWCYLKHRREGDYLQLSPGHAIIQVTYYQVTTA